MTYPHHLRPNLILTGQWAAPERPQLDHLRLSQKRSACVSSPTPHHRAVSPIFRQQISSLEAAFIGSLIVDVSVELV